MTQTTTAKADAPFEFHFGPSTFTLVPKPKEVTGPARNFSHDKMAAREYVDSRMSDALKFFSDLKWTEHPGMRFCLTTTIYGVDIIHEMVPGTLNKGQLDNWGELINTREENEEPVPLKSFECFVAYMLSRYW